MKRRRRDEENQYSTASEFALALKSFSNSTSVRSNSLSLLLSRAPTSWASTSSRTTKVCSEIASTLVTIASRNSITAPILLSFLLSTMLRPCDKENYRKCGTMTLCSGSSDCQSRWAALISFYLEILLTVPLVSQYGAEFTLSSLSKNCLQTKVCLLISLATTNPLSLKMITGILQSVFYTVLNTKDVEIAKPSLTSLIKYLLSMHIDQNTRVVNITLNILSSYNSERMDYFVLMALASTKVTNRWLSTNSESNFTIGTLAHNRHVDVSTIRHYIFRKSSSNKSIAYILVHRFNLLHQHLSVEFLQNIRNDKTLPSILSVAFQHICLKTSLEHVVINDNEENNFMDEYIYPRAVQETLASVSNELLSGYYQPLVLTSYESIIQKKTKKSKAVVVVPQAVKVFGIQEIVENILKFSSAKRLWRLRYVSKIFKETAFNSQRLWKDIYKRAYPKILCRHRNDQIHNYRSMYFAKQNSIGQFLCYYCKCDYAAVNPNALLSHIAKHVKYTCEEPGCPNPSESVTVKAVAAHKKKYH